jgi:putative endonuclease
MLQLIFCFTILSFIIKSSLRGNPDYPGSVGMTKQSQVMDKQFYAYVMANDSNTVTYTGVTGNIKRRVFEHKEKFLEGFTQRYNISKLVYYEIFGDVINAITREKQIKGGLRNSKTKLIERMNKDWQDLYYEL